MLLSNLIKNAALESPYASKLDNEYIESLIESFTSDPSKCLYYNDYGFIAGMVTSGHILLPDTLIALEVAWYVLPEERNKMVGGRLYKQFEEWAKSKEIKAIFVGKPIKDSILVQPGYMKWVSRHS